MYHYLYKTTNIVTGDYYIGRHSAESIDDGYLGSGLRIAYAIKKYGKENFKKEILQFCETTEELWELEENFITDEILDDPKCLNIGYGGVNYLRSLKKRNYEKFLEHQSAAGKIGGQNMLLKMTPEQKREWHKKGRLASTGAKGKTWNHSAESKQNYSRAASARIKLICNHCNKYFDSGNFKKHSNKIGKEI